MPSTSPAKHLHTQSHLEKKLLWRIGSDFIYILCTKLTQGALKHVFINAAYRSDFTDLFFFFKRPLKIPLNNFLKKGKVNKGVTRWHKECGLVCSPSIWVVKFCELKIYVRNPLKVLVFWQFCKRILKVKQRSLFSFPV